MAEYKGLIQEKLGDGLTAEQEKRLAELMRQLNALDQADPLTQQSVAEIAQVRQKLTNLRQEIEAELAIPVVSSPSQRL